ncbi:aminoglycoside phosphotransferase family protein [Microbacterium sp. ZW T5_56]|uniref:aminoglycoside phosphotransferase family protein n=1 Tax=Microbacterium sp. ZW T5_56 TaxID=3378081 RepID=UPI0038544E9E
MSEPPRSFVIPAQILRAFDIEATRAWAAGLSATTHDLLEAWELRPDGTVLSGEAGVVVPVRRADDSPAALKIQPPRTETTAAILGLTRWDGRGSVQLLDSDADRGAMLLERLHADRSLESAPEDESIRIVGSLLLRLHSAPAPTGLPQVGAVVDEMTANVPGALRLLTQDDRSRVDRWLQVMAEVRPEPGDRLLHWDLHHGNVLAADREPWLAIDPEPLVGDPGFDLWPALDSGWSADETVTDAGRIVRRRFDVLTEMLGLDRARAAAWTTARLLQNTLWDIEDGHTAISAAAIVIDDALKPSRQ